MTLYSNELLSGDNKGYIDSFLTNKEKTEYLLDKVIKPGLEIEYTELFDEMLRIMKTSDDRTVNYLVDKIEKFTLRAPPLPVEQKPVASQGNHTNNTCAHAHTCTHRACRGACTESHTHTHHKTFLTHCQWHSQTFSDSRAHYCHKILSSYL